MRDTRAAPAHVTSAVHGPQGNGGAWDRHHDGIGSDRLRPELTSADWARPEAQGEIRAFQAMLDAANGGSVPFAVRALNLRITNFEAPDPCIDSRFSTCLSGSWSCRARSRTKR